MILDFSTIEDEYERKVAIFLDKIGFDFVYSRSQFNKSEAEVAREIDLLFTYQKCSFIIEVSTLQKGRNFKIITFLYRWSKRKNCSVKILSASIKKLSASI